MQLLIAIVQDEDAGLLCRHLNAQGFRVTRVSTVGGFLARGNVTILVGVENEQVEAVMAVIRATCRTRRSFINPMPWGAEPTHLSVATPAMPLEVLIGGATVFALPVKRFLRLQGGTATESSNAGSAAPPTAGVLDMVLSIMAIDDADRVTPALLSAGYRVTRINTAGAFLRRGNATLLIGVDTTKVDDVLRIMQARCCPREGANAATASATVFVLEAVGHFHL